LVAIDQHAACAVGFVPDPKVAVAALIYQDKRVLLVRRMNEPYRGKWSLPAGFMDAGELPETALARECLEETGLHVRILEFFQLLSGRTHPNGADLLLIFLAEVVSGVIKAGDDAEEAKFFALDELPDLAFENTEFLLRLNFKINRVFAGGISLA
jgi:ADP-ribose pyrophosphatase YjhB (NUDIX family)